MDMVNGDEDRPPQTQSSSQQSLNCPFDVIVVTSPDQASARAALEGPLAAMKRDIFGCKDNENHPQKGVPLILSTSDPFDARMGSGGGTIAALDHADFGWEAERKMAADKGDGPPSVLVVHAGGESSRCPTQMTLGKAWTSLPILEPKEKYKKGGLQSHGGERMIGNPTAMIIQRLCELFAEAPRGTVVIAASDCLFSLPNCDALQLRDEVTGMLFEKEKTAVIGLAVPSPLNTAKNHGVFVLEPHIAANGGSSRSTSASSISDMDNGHSSKLSGMERRTKYRKIESFVSEISSTSISDSTYNRIKPVTKFFQKPSVDVMNNAPCCTFLHNDEPSAWIDTGVVAFLPESAGTLRRLASQELACCTERGLRAMYEKEERKEIDIADFAKEKAQRVELYSHLMLAISTKESESLKNSHGSSCKRRNEFIEMHKGELPMESLETIYDTMCLYELNVCAVPAGQFSHLGTTRELMNFLTYGTSYDSPISNVEESSTMDIGKRMMEKRCRNFGKQAHLVKRSSAFVSNINVHTSVVILNSALVCTNDREEMKHSNVGRNSIFEHTHMIAQDGLDIGSDCLISGLRGYCEKKIVIPDGMCIQVLPLKGELSKDNNGDGKTDSEYVYMYLGVSDPIKKATTVYGLDFDSILQRTGLTRDDLWDESTPTEKQTLWTAKLHPVVLHSRNADGKIMITDNAIDLSPLLWITKLCQSSGPLSDDALKSLKTWKALPRLSLSSIRMSSDAKEEFKYREDLTHNVVPSLRCDRFTNVKNILLQQRHEPCMFDFVIDGHARGQADDLYQALETLDEVIVEAMAQGMYNVVERSFMILSALLSDIADSLECSSAKQLDKAEGKVAIPQSLSSSKEKEFRSSMDDLRLTSINTEKRIASCRKLFTLRDEVLFGKEENNFHLASEQMELAAAALTELCVSGCGDAANKGILASLRRTEPSPRDCWVVASAPGRIDLDGAWSDTPPVSYDYGGSVLTMANTVDGRRPLSSRCRVISGGKGVFLRTEGREIKGGKLIGSAEVRMNNLSDIADFRHPEADCTLLKCALISLGFVSLDQLSDSEDTSLQPLINAFCSSCGEDVGLEIVSTSMLPRGSGMGTSSILGGCVLASIARCVGLDVLSSNSAEKEDDDFLILGVLMMEQLLSTGGGWQDQIGGLIGGMKLSTSKAQAFPLQIKAGRRQLDPKICANLNKRLVLAFSGQPRLAKSVLQHVLRRWARRTPEIVSTVEGLVENSVKSAQAIDNNDLDALGCFMNLYWTRKKKMCGEASGVEPKPVADLLKALLERKDIVGGTLLGAGGGGFLLMIASEGRTVRDIENTVKNELTGLNPDVYNFTWHECSFCEEGLKIKIIDNKAMSNSSEEDFDVEWHD